MRDWSTEITTLTDRIGEFYVFPDVGAKLQDLLRGRLRDGDYRDVLDEKTFADVVSTDMQSVNADPHLFLVHSEQVLPERDEPTVEEGKRRAERARLANYGFAKVERLRGNIGLLELRNFYDPAVGDAGTMAVAAMQLVAGADALLIDLRHNTGGEPEMVALVSSFLYDEPTHLVDLVFPASGVTQQFWTAPFVPGPRFGGGKPLFVLISTETFSAAEGISYQLQQAKRATLVGEGSVGAPATFHYRYRVSEHLLCAVPSGYPRDPISGGNWAGTGVLPDLAVPAQDAFDTAYRLALQHVLTLDATGERERVARDAQLALEAMPT